MIEVVVPRETNRAGKLFSPFFVISLILFGTVIWGFWQSYFWPLMTFSAERSWLIHVHATVFVGWMVLLVAQALAVSLGNRQFHRRFGVAGMGFAVLVFIVGLIVSVEVPAAGARAGDFPLEIAGLVAVYLVTDMLIFGALMVAAMADRAQPAFHKRLIVCATVALTTAAIGRVLPAGSLIFYLAWLAPLFVLIGVDLVKLKRPHVVSIAALALLTFAFFKNDLLAQLPAARSVGLLMVSPWI